MHKENTKNDHFRRSSPQVRTHDRISRRTGNRDRISIHGIHKVWRGSGFHRRGAWLCYGLCISFVRISFCLVWFEFQFRFSSIFPFVCIILYPPFLIFPGRSRLHEVRVHFYLSDRKLRRRSFGCDALALTLAFTRSNY
ncbi:hypothetical protein BDV33DRAFT_145150 [Aspergillus novoparasiticus]|uniref:Uncharacterized protein n=1 Tax=Aspergillus novoparasiticus TaxID=986946 RepID=A0A5N6F4F1_9EURO|nr:hypothetical protein BDV33DRAFT_145150 [Aspergillus novoparasiticus]